MLLHTVTSPAAQVPWPVSVPTSRAFNSHRCITLLQQSATAPNQNKMTLASPPAFLWWIWLAPFCQLSPARRLPWQQRVGDGWCVLAQVDNCCSCLLYLQPYGFLFLALATTAPDLSAASAADSCVMRAALEAGQARKDTGIEVKAAGGRWRKRGCQGRRTCSCSSFLLLPPAVYSCLRLLMEDVCSPRRPCMMALMPCTSDHYYRRLTCASVVDCFQRLGCIAACVTALMKELWDRLFVIWTLIRTKLCYLHSSQNRSLSTLYMFFVSIVVYYTVY